MKIGTNRIVFSIGGKVLKIPRHRRGIKANKIEYANYRAAPQGMVAETSLYGIALVQEKLSEIEVYTRDAKREEIPDYAKPLYDIKVENRLQIGKDKSGEWKIFDYEDVKFYEELMPQSTQ